MPIASGPISALRNALRSLLTLGRREPAPFDFNESRLRTLVETLRAIPWEADADCYNMTYVGPQIEALTGYTPAQWMASGWERALHPEDRDRAIAEYNENLSRRADHNIEYRLIHTDGRVMWWRDVITFVKGADGKLIVRGVMFDIDEEKRLEQALLEGAARYRQAERIGKLGHLNILVNPEESWEHHVVILSEVAREILGSDTTRLINTEYWSHVHPDDRDMMRSALVDGIQACKREISVTYRVVRPDGSLRWVIEHVENEYDKAGRRISAIGTIQDITAQKQVEMELLRTKRYLERAQNIAKVGIFAQEESARAVASYDPTAPLPDDIYYSATGVAITGLTQESRRTISDQAFCERYVHPDDSARTLAYYKMLAQAPNGMFEHEYRFIRPDGRLIHLREQAQISLDAATNRRTMEIIFQDITDLRQRELEARQREQQLLQSQKLESLGVLAGGIAHDINNVLAGVAGYANLAKMRIDNSQQVSSFMEKILHCVATGKGTVSRIMAFCRRSDLEKTNVELKRILSDTVVLLKHSLPANVDISFHADARDYFIRADANQIQQVVLNLCNNAAQAMASGGTIRVELKESDTNLVIDDRRQTPQLFASLTIADTGPGIPDEIRSRIFDPFFTTKEAGKGTGLGLAIAMNIVRNHGGSISFETETDIGTTFRVLLPLVQPEASVPVSEPSLADDGIPMGNGERILLVDDDVALAEGTGLLMTHLNYRVTTCTSPFTALELVRKDPSAFDILVTDIKMPGMTGEELIAKVLGVRGDVPVVVMTGYDGSMQQLVFDAAVKYVLQKPVACTDLAAALRRTLASRFDRKREPAAEA